MAPFANGRYGGGSGGGGGDYSYPDEMPLGMGADPNYYAYYNVAKGIPRGYSAGPSFEEYMYQKWYDSWGTPGAITNSLWKLADVFDFAGFNLANRDLFLGYKGFEEMTPGLYNLAMADLAMGESIRQGNNFLAFYGPGDGLGLAKAFWTIPGNEKFAYNQSKPAGAGPYIIINPSIAWEYKPGTYKIGIPNTETMYDENGKLIGVCQNNTVIWVSELEKDSIEYWRSWRGFLQTTVNQGTVPRGAYGLKHSTGYGNYQKVPKSNKAWEIIYNLIINQ